MKQKLNAKDFILIGVLTALMWIICMIISTIMSVAGPVTNVFYPSVVAIPNGIVMMLLLAKVPKKGVFTICAAIQAMPSCTTISRPLRKVFPKRLFCCIIIPAVSATP